MELTEVLDRIRSYMELVSETQGLDLESVEFGDRSITIKDWADLNLVAIRDMSDNEALYGFVAAE